ncbi:MAG: RNA polymerase sigma factor [Myxococcales bacterium]|nr:RNA polymerase sigma factor [Myxococcales bacterium]
MSDLVHDMAEARLRFMELVADVRPELHRYCTRMTGSVFDGEDVVQDTLAKAFYALAEMESAPPLRPWLFRIAHNTALDFLRRAGTHVSDVDLLEVPMTDTVEPDGARVEAALQVFASLPPLQRSALAFKDVLGLSLEQTAENMSVSVLAVKAALVRARAKVATTAANQAGAPIDLDRLRTYAHLFNERNWDEETRLDLVSRHQRRGRGAAEYFTRYADAAPKEDLRAEAGFVEGRPVIAMFRPSSSARPAYFVTLEFGTHHVTLVRDYRHVPTIALEATFTSTP